VSSLLRRLGVRSRPLIVILAWTAACQSTALLAPEESAGENPGRIAFYDDQPIIDVPASAPLGSNVDVIITTYGSLCDQVGRTDILQTGSRVDLYPIDIFPEPRGCADALVLFQHHVSFSPRARGLLVLSVHGTEVSSVGGAVQRRPLTVVRNVTIE